MTDVKLRISAAMLCVASALLASGCAAPPAPPTPTYTSFAFNDQSATGMNVVQVEKAVPDGLGNSLSLAVAIGDLDFASDGGYSWLASTFYQNAQAESCRYAIVKVRARAVIAQGPSSGTYRLDFDGYETDGYVDFQDVPGPWDFGAGDQPTLYVESMTIDLSKPATCVWVYPVIRLVTRG